MTVAQILYFQQWSIIIFLALLLLISISNLLGMRRLGAYPPAQETPMVSILVPARNEARNIEICVRSLLAQDYPAFELLVLDDESEDGTGEILAHLQVENPRLQMLRGKPLPDGWLGKNWACHQLAQAAHGTYLLFTDADTRHHPRMLAGTMALAEATQADFLSGIPAQDTVTWAEKLSVPMIPWMEHTTVPVALVRTGPFAALANAVGQFILYRRSAYEQTGGHAAARDTVIEDFVLPRRVKRLGLRWDLVDVAGYVRTRMYQNLSEVWNGYSKNLFAAFNYNLPVFAFIWLWMFFVAWQPFVWIFLNQIGNPVPGYSLSLALASILMQMLLWLIPDLRFRMPVIQVVFFPITITIFLAIAARSAYRHLARKPLSWKGRRI